MRQNVLPRHSQWHITGIMELIQESYEFLIRLVHGCVYMMEEWCQHFSVRRSWVET